jgi:hypothetical protein
MSFNWKVWKITITLNLVDIDPTDGNLKIGLVISWK